MEEKKVNQVKKVEKTLKLKGYKKPKLKRINGEVVLGSCCFVNTYKTQ